MQNPTLTRKLWFFNIYLFTMSTPNPILFDIIKFYSTQSVFKIIWIVCIELWEVYINFIWSRFGIRRHLLAFSINKRNQYWNIVPLVLSTILKDFFTSFIVEWNILRNHWLRNYFVKLVDRGECKIIRTRLTMFGRQIVEFLHKCTRQNCFSSRFWRVGERWFLSLQTTNYFS